MTALLRSASKRLYTIRGLKKFVDSAEVITVYHAIITSLFTYASPVFGRLPVKLMSKLERFQKRAHKIICGLDCACTRFPLLSSRFEEIAVKLLLLAEVNPLHPLHDFVPPRLPASGHLSLPFCATSRRQRSFFPWATQVHDSCL